jgi:putative membrane-bound dehydrogenase-like protein
MPGQAAALSHAAAAPSRGHRPPSYSPSDPAASRVLWVLSSKTPCFSSLTPRRPSAFVLSLLLAITPLAAAPYDPMHDPRRPVANSPSLSAEETAKALKVPPGFSVQVVAAEPQIRQPVGYTMDDRGRLWVLENTNYPKCPGEPRDRILILEDTDLDGKADRQKVFYDKLTFATGIAVGFGGVWVGAPPNLLFFPDTNRDDKPDGAPEVVLDGWGYEDTHETINNFTWGPDGWLYGTHGVFTFSKVGTPGTPAAERVPVNAAVWRFHPLTGKFERYNEGASNQWGLDWNDRGQAFFEACVIPHAWQCIQGARYARQAGQPSNPHTYEEVQTIGDFEYEKRAYCGSMIYLGGLFPPELRDTWFFIDIHMNKMRNEKMVRRGSGYAAKRNLDFIVSTDPWFRGLSPQYGPEGAIYLNDWYDKVPCYQQREQVDRSNGRLYRITYKDAKPVRVDLNACSDDELVELQLHQNDWYVRHARRLLQERGANPAVHEALAKILRENADETRQLRALWALHATEGLTLPLAVQALKKPSEYVRAWTVQLLCEDGAPSAEMLARLTALAKNDPSPLVRLYLASAAGRLPIARRWPVLFALASHGEDSADQNLPCLIWYAAEPAVAAEPIKGLELLSACKLEKLQELIARRIASGT